MRHFFFFVPIFYFYVTRIKSIPALINWIFIYVVPTFTLFYLMSIESNPLHVVISAYILIVLSVYSIYEAGYIQNDTETIKLETNPTLRLNEEQLRYYDKKKKSIYTMRAILSLGLLFGVIVLLDTLGNQIYSSLMALVSIAIGYYFYNQTRSIFTLIIFFILVSLRYTTPLLIVLKEDYIFYILLIIALYPIINLLDWLYKPQFKKYALPYSQNRVRIVYYLLGSTVFTLLFYFSGNEQLGVASFLFIYFLVYRIIFSQIQRQSQ